MQLKRKWITLLVGTILLITAACVPQAAPTPGAGEVTPTVPVPQTGSELTPTGGVAGADPLANTRWTLVSLGLAGAQTAVVGDTGLTLNFDAQGQATGEGGCNSFGARYAVDGDSIMFEPVTSTLIACEDEQVMQQEADYFAALNTASRFEIAGDRLTIETAGQETLIFERQ